MLFLVFLHVVIIVEKVAALKSRLAKSYVNSRKYIYLQKTRTQCMYARVRLTLG